MPDAIFDDPRLAQIYDHVDDDRSDLAAYLSLVQEHGARSVLDIGCGTGTFACLLAARGIAMTAVDPALASLDVARGKPHGKAVRWLQGDATSLPPLRVDMVTMTGNVAQVFLTDEEWATTLGAAHSALRPGGRLVFEVRDPDRRAWGGWTTTEPRRVEVPQVGMVEISEEVTDVSLPLVSFRITFRFQGDGAVITSDSTLRFRNRGEIEETLAAAAFDTAEVRDAPDRPGLEFVFIAAAGGAPRDRSGKDR
jgi:SAM-dependent methyltransferase